MKLALWTVFLLVLGVKGKMVCYEKVECFTDEKPWSGTIERKLSHLPLPPESINVRLLLYTKDDPEKSQLVDPLTPDTVLGSSFKTTRKSRFIIHGFIDSGEKDWLSNMCKAMLQVEDVNCFCVDWSGGSRTVYSLAANNIRVVGAVVAYFIKTLVLSFGYSPSLVHVIGHSLGAHAAGEVGKRMPGISRITGLDPAEPYFQNTPPEVRLDPTDAKFVDVIHTDSVSIFDKLGTKGYGMSQLVGHLDFFPNGGEDMPGCKRNILHKFLDPEHNFEGRFIPCDHLRSYKYYTESILIRDGFIGYPADSYNAFIKGVGFPCPSGGCPLMGHYADQYQGVISNNQKYYLNTGAEIPFSRWTYKVTIKIGGVREFLGNFHVALRGTSGTYEKYEIQKGQIHEDETYMSFIDSKIRPIYVPRVQIYFWQDLSAKRTDFCSVKITLQNGKDGQIFTFCGKKNIYDKNQIIKPCKAASR